MQVRLDSGLKGKTGRGRRSWGLGVTRAATPFDGSNRNLAKLWFEQVAFPAACRRLGRAWRSSPTGARPGERRAPSWSPSTT